MKKSLKFAILFILSCSFSLSKNYPIFAQNNPVPQEIVEIINNIDSAGNKKDLTLIETNIAPNFITEDGLNIDNLKAGLEKFWSRYKDLKYRTTIDSWKENQGQIIAITTTNIQGNYEINGKKFNLNSTIKSEQYFQNNKLVKQNILEEKNEITSGNNPPIVTINLPTTARPGQEFDFDVILQDPIASDLVLGAALEDKFDPNLYVKPSSFKLDSLSAGGIFKRVKLPNTEKDHWYSVILIRKDGLRMITQRVKIES